MGENNNGIEQPVEPMSRVESILREEDVQRPLSRIEDLLIKGGGGGGSTVTITPTLSSGTKVADYSINGEEGALYAPGSNETEITGTLTAGATSLVLTNNVITDSATYDFYTDTFGVSPTAVSIDNSNHQLTLTFDAQPADVAVKVRVS